ncbi:MAG: hypothetical protein ACR2PG_26325 [Hyphomicrobiaceae bacterium]
MLELHGGCHCGNIGVTYRTCTPPENSRTRACQCTFCRKHQTRAVSDPAGFLEISLNVPEAINRYQFGIGSCDFIVCRDCGVYVAAYMPDPDDVRGYATLMASVLIDHARFPEATPTHYDNETGSERAERRRRVWTPAAVRTEAE